MLRCWMSECAITIVDALLLICVNCSDGLLSQLSQLSQLVRYDCVNKRVNTLNANL